MSQSLRKPSSRKPLKFSWKQVAGRNKDNLLMYSGSVTLVGADVYWIGTAGEMAVFSCKTWTWKKLEHRLPSYHFWYGTALVDDKIYFFGAGIWHLRTFPEYDILLACLNSVETRNDAVFGEIKMTYVFAAWRNEIITFGGILPGSWDISNGTQALNMASMCWRKLECSGALPEPRRDHTATLCGSKMYIFGGSDRDFNKRNDIWVLELRSGLTQTWSSPNIYGIAPSPRAMASLNHLNGKLVVLGGLLADRNEEQGFHFYLPDFGSWEDQSSCEFEPMDPDPRKIEYNLGLTTGTGILYFVSSGIYLLSQE